ncbi:uncharacterized protein LOC131637439 [Vicia villosa]|uniref:uncharacterized protein LOC131637439 n=1 Tax=Vicia villosa TaxID=3911 RepID=UPI00273C4F19|nr:uncharacterized protein LOC131637439 [Vicia villosa]
MPLSQALQHLLKANLITVRDPPKNVTTTYLNYDPNAKCVYHSNCPGHHADNWWALKNKIQDMIDASEIEFDPSKTPNVITAPMPKHDKTVNAIIDTVHVYDVRDLFEKIPSIENLCKGFSRGLKIEDVSVISKAPLKIPTKAPFKISTEPRVAPIIITRPSPISYSSDKAIPWNYGAEVYIQGVKQELIADKVSEDANLDVEISPNTASPTATIIPNQNADTRGKGPLHEPVQTPVETVTENPSSEEANEFLKIIRKSDYDIIEQMGHTPSKISMLSLLSCSKTHAKAMMKFLEAAHVPQEISVTQLENCIAILTTDNYLRFSDADLSPSGKNHNKALHISIECGGTTLAHVLVENGSSLNVLPKLVLDKLNPEGIVLKSSDVIVKAFDGSMSTVYGEVELPIRVGSHTFNIVFYVMDIHPAYSCLLGRPWIHGANV